MGIFDKVAKVGSKVLKDVTSEESKAKAKELLGAVGEKLNEAAEKVTSEETKAKAKEIFGNVSEKVSSVANSAKDYVNDALKEEKTAEEKVTYTTEFVTDEKSCKEKIASVLESEFAGYTVKEDFSPILLGGDGRFMNAAFAVFANDKPKLFIMVIGKTTCSHREYRFTKQFAESHGITLINFIKHYPNETSYITNRLHRYL